MILKVGDKFNSIKDVMDNVFEWNYKAYYKGWYALDENDRYSAWFPKIAKAPKMPGEVWHGWVNVLCDDGSYIFMKNYSEPMRMEKEISQNIHITFTKKPGQMYEYSGCYIRTNLDEELGWIYKRVEKDIDTELLKLVPRVINK